VSAARIVAALAAALVLAAAARAQTNASIAERLRLIEQQGRDNGEVPAYLQLPVAPGRPFDWGGWVTAADLLFHGENHNSTPSNTTSILLEDARLWFSGDLSDRIQYYVRVRYQDYDVNTNPGATRPNLKQQEGIQLDQAFVDYKISKNVEARVGRQFMKVGRGLSLAADLDGATVDYVSPQWTHRALVGRSLDRDPGVDTSVTGYDQGTARHDFVGGESRLRTPSGRQFYLYALVEHDESHSLDPAQNAQNFAYDAHYFGFGTEGRLDPMLNYFLEVVAEGGTTLQGVAPFLRVPISSYASTSGLQWFPPWFWRPQASLELSYGSGNRFRTSVTNTFGGGNAIPVVDTNFLYFGAYDGGLALSPRLSNLIVARLGYQVKPLPADQELLPELVVGATASHYWKDEKDGAISDTLATQSEYDVGSAVDLYVGTRPLSDFSALVQYGRFSPGSAYPVDQRAENHRVFVTATQSF